MSRILRGDDVLNTTFTQTQFRRGYDEREVDDFLDRAVVALRHHESGRPVAEAPMSSRDVEGVRFTQTQLRRGYDEEEVDTLLADLAGTLAQHEAGGSAAGSAAEAAAAAAAAVDGSAVPGSAGSGAARSARPAGIPYAGGILIEEESWCSKLLRRLRGDKG
ncbi:MAG TPA: DivIVA domain-containing protein [Ornithinibacter sp.]|nr:DivIVA domain-containing protein [Ornithinibacter sp.]